MGRTVVGVHEKVWPRVKFTDSCWLWQGKIVRGYGKVANAGFGTLAHRVVYQVLVGPVPEGLEIDHLCRVRHCVNPEHLELVTHQENMRRAAPHRPKTRPKRESKKLNERSVM